MVNYIKVMRLQTLTASLAPVVCAYALASSEGIMKQMHMLFPCIMVAVFIQIAVNIFNDIIDGKNGVDANRMGDERVSGKTSTKVLWGMAFSSLVICLYYSFTLFYLHPAYIPLGLLSLFFAYGYTGGPYPLAYNGLGEIFVYLFFGLVAFNGTYYALTNQLSTSSLFCSSLFGMLSVLIIYANNYRDMFGDKVFNKRTIAVIFEQNAKEIFYFFIIISILHKLAISIYLKAPLIFIICVVGEITLSIALAKKLNRQKIFKLAILNLVSTAVTFYFII